MQLRECCIILSYRQSGDMEKEINTILSNNTMLDEKCFLKLHGSYTLWQEVSYLLLLIESVVYNSL